MPLTLSCGPANSGKVRAIVDRFLGHCDEGGGWLIVPTRADMRRAVVEVVGRRGALVSGHIGTFRDFARWCVPDERRSDLGAGVDMVIIRRLLAGMQGSFPSQEYPGFVVTATRMVSELRHDAFAGKGALAERMHGMLDAERDAWTALVEAFGRELDRLDLVDDAGIEHSAVDRVATIPTMLPVCVYGFDDLNHSQVELLVACSRRVDVDVTLPFVPGRIVFERRQQLVDRLRSSGAVVQVGGVAAFDSPVLAQLEDRLFEPTADAVDAPGSGAVRFVECSGDLQEAEEVVAAVARQLLAGVEPGEIACLSTAPSKHRSLLEVCFRRAGIPVVIEVPRRMDDTPAGRAIISLVDAAAGSDASQCLAFLQSRISPLRPDDARILARRIDMVRSAATAGDQPPAWVDDPAITPVVRDLMIAPRVGADPAAALRAVLASLQPAAPGDRRLIAGVIESIDILVASLRHGQVTVRELADLVEQFPIAAPEDRPDGHVVIAPVSRVRTDRFRSVILWGFDSAPDGSMIVADDDRLSIAREQAYAAITRATACITCIRQGADETGSVRAESSTWTELRRLVPVEPLTRGLDAVTPALARIVVAYECERTLDAIEGDSPGASLSPDRRAHPQPIVSAGGRFVEWMVATGEVRATELEDWLTCPARWFIGRHLLPEDRDRPSHRRTVGTLAHAALERAVPQLLTDHAAGSDDVTVRRRIAANAVDASVARLAQRMHIDPVDIAAAHFIVTRYVRDEWWYGERVETEQAFGSSASDGSPVTIDGMTLSGRIDRIDIAADGTVVLHDYKLARQVTAGAKLASEGRLQLPLYARALRDARGYRPVAALYRPLEGTRPRGLIDADAGLSIDGSFGTDAISEEAFDQRIDEAIAVARTAIDGIRRGVVAATPREGTCPDWCDLQAICRIEGR